MEDFSKSNKILFVKGASMFDGLIYQVENFNFYLTLVPDFASSLYKLPQLFYKKER